LADNENAYGRWKHLVGKEGRVDLSVLDAGVLLMNVYLAAKNQNVGYEDINRSLDNLVRQFIAGGTVPLRTDVFESAAWSANLLSERNEFWHPRDYSFDRFMDGCLQKGQKFDKVYNRIVKK
jgi:hypothetical protein